MVKKLEIDLTDPRVQAALGHDEGGIVAPEGKRELVTLAGDQDHGISQDIHLDASKSVVAVWYPGKELLLELDVHHVPGAPIEVHAICPKCHNALRITSDRKAIEWDPRSENPMRKVIAARLSAKSVARAAMGKISIATFQCTWEMNAKQSVAKDMTIASGNLCKWTAAIENNRVVED